MAVTKLGFDINKNVTHVILCEILMWENTWQDRIFFILCLSVRFFFICIWISYAFCNFHNQNSNYNSYVMIFSNYKLQFM